MFVVRCLLPVVCRCCCSFVVVVCFCGLMLDAWCLWFVACCLSLLVERCVVFVACCLMFVVCCMLFVAVW